ncbi:MAG: thiamine phosphate synthase [Bacteroidales bacterium]|nr:thiamine phosphate synthase [Bacteroidales bacterium]
MKLIAISIESFAKNESDALCALFNTGLELFHLRKPVATEEEMRNFLQQLPAQFYNRIVLHDHFLLLEEFNLKGVHLNTRNTTPPQTSMHISKSCHSLEELQTISEFDYVFVSPIFDSISKQGYARAFSHKELVKAKNEGRINENVMALGGISSETVEIARNYGFGGVAVLGALWGDFENTSDIGSLLQRFATFKKLCTD